MGILLEVAGQAVQAAQAAQATQASPPTISLLAMLITGGLMGFLGQGARAVVGLKGMADEAKASGLSSNDLFQAARLVTSLFIGFLVGLAAALVYIKTNNLTNGITEPDWQTLLSIVASGYLGTDFLEGFISQYLPQSTVGSTISNFAAAQPIKPAVVAQAAKPAAQKPPVFTQTQAQNYVVEAFAALGFTDVKFTDPLTKYNLSGPTTLLGLALQINKVLPQTAEITDDVALGWTGKKVSDVVTSVQYA